MIKYDGKLTIATGVSAQSKVWKNKEFKWSEFAKRLSEEHKTTETYKEFISATKLEQFAIKNIGGYVGGYLRNGRRSPANVVHRQLMTLDIDFAHIDFWDDFKMMFNNAALIHSTHKHCEADPRYRLIIPINRECTPDEYVAISRKIAGTMGIDLFDNTTFETNRLMFWPSNPKDVDYYFEFQDGPWVDADEVLAGYIDWKDTSLWPMADKKFQEIYDAAKKQQDPTAKKNIVGAFCRTYGISEVIDAYLQDVYSPAANGRHTYAKGTTAAGLVIYDDTFANSHHGTDPCSGLLCNAFDLVRIHLFGHLDSDGVSGVKAKSFGEMQELALKDKHVKKTIATEKLSGAALDFADIEDEEIDTFAEDNTEWAAELEVDRRGAYLSTAGNITIILNNDTRLKNAFKHNKFDNKFYVCKTLPWRRVANPEPIRNVDFAGVRNYTERIYGIAGSSKVEDALMLEFEKQSFHPVRDYLNSITWDGTARVDTLLIDYFGVEDTLYTREAMRIQLVGAVSRIFNPGSKFDSVLLLVGEQGTKKSSFIHKLGGNWYSDTFMTVQGKEALEQIQGVWLIEMAELAGLRKAEVESIKHFISKQEDVFRPAYARTSETFKRQCVFFGTTNDLTPLKDPTGNRRFNPVLVRPYRVTKDVFTHLDDEVNQIWAEAVTLFKSGSKRYLSKEAEVIAKLQQTAHSEFDERRGVVEQFLDFKLPQDWDTKDLAERRVYLEMQGEGTESRDRVCIAEIWCECLGKEKDNMTNYNTRPINDIMKGLTEWEAGNTNANFSFYGKQRYYQRKL